MSTKVVGVCVRWGFTIGSAGENWRPRGAPLDNHGCVGEEVDSEGWVNGGGGSWVEQADTLNSCGSFPVSQ